jgi:3-hydroxyisobutyrate dehydrogenase-like beta-hydroxyacid dehydrogenase
VDCSTIGPAETRAIGAALKERDLDMLDAPVTGSSPRAQAGTLTIMVGGEERAFERARAVLEAMGELVVHVGPLGQGEMVKLINNSLGAANAAARWRRRWCWPQSAGIDLDALTKVVGAGSALRAARAEGGPMREHDYTTLFKAEHMLKDVRLCLRRRKGQVSLLRRPHATCSRPRSGAARGGGDHA